MSGLAAAFQTKRNFLLARGGTGQLVLHAVQFALFVRQLVAYGVLRNGRLLIFYTLGAQGFLGLGKRVIIRNNFFGNRVLFLCAGGFFPLYGFFLAPVSFGRFYAAGAARQEERALHLSFRRAIITANNVVNQVFQLGHVRNLFFKFPVLRLGRGHGGKHNKLGAGFAVFF